jgi:hypothetical protein
MANYSPFALRRKTWSRIARTAWLLAPLTIIQSVSTAHASPFTLGAFDDYGILLNMGTGDNADINTPPVNANIGVGNIGQLNLHNEQVNGQVDFAGSSTGHVQNGTITGTQPASLGGPALSSINSNVAGVTAAITAASALASTYGAEAGSGTSITVHNANISINATNGFLDASGARVFTTNGFGLNHNTLTINGSASDYVVIDITGNSNIALDGAITLTGGITSDQVLINYIGTGNVQGAANGATLDGTFLFANASNISLSSETFDGHVFDGGDGTFNFVSNTYINQPTELHINLTGPVPEPSTWAMLLLGFAGLGFMAYRRKSKARIDGGVIWDYWV